MFDVVIILVVVLIIVALMALVAIRSSDGGPMEFSYDLSEGERFLHRWGYTDTKFEFVDPRTVRVTGDRYPISGDVMPHFIPFAEEVLGVPFRPEDVSEELHDKGIQAPKTNPAFWEAAKSAFDADQLSQEDADRLVHSHGQLSVDEIYRLLYEASLDRVADAVFYPKKEEDVRAIVRLADRHEVVLVPYGGGTNVSGALMVPAHEERMVISVDMRDMNRILWLDPENMQACIEAGISGKQMEKALFEKGYTAGHDPDSIELSTLGGWISTCASGMKKNKYGNIEEVVIEATLVTPTGDIEVKRATPRNSTGIQPKSLLFGSEGNLGIITKAVVKLHHLPERQAYGSLVFPNFEKGVAFLKHLRQREGVLPASIRLVNNFEFRFGQALKPAPGAWKGLMTRFQKFYLFKILGFDPKEMVACTILMEGARSEVEHQMAVILATAKKFGGVSGGSHNGRRGYMLTFAIAYIRDFFNQFHVLGETFETTVPWDRILPLTQAVRETLVASCRECNVAGTPYLSFRVTQTYQTGVCVYFTMGFSGKGLKQPTRTYHAIEERIRQVILDSGGSLSHHHGVGKIRRHFLPRIMSENSLAVFRKTKSAMDPKNIFAIGNGAFHGPEPMQTTSCP